MNFDKERISLLCETSWEVCNKVGGIYTVLSSKAAQLVAEFGDKAVFIGPDLRKNGGNADFIPRKTIWKKQVAKIQLPYGISVCAGKWNIDSSPTVVLVDYSSVFPMLNEIYGKMWEQFGVDSLHSYGDYGESCAFAFAAAHVVKALASLSGTDSREVLAHFDEWTTGMGLLALRDIMPEVATVFTTHATSIGRSICGNNKPLYDQFENYNGDQMARELNMEAKHSLEKTAARNADCFTTVSDVTARECTQLLGVTPQVITPNGFNLAAVPSSAKYAAARRNARKRILEVASKVTGISFDEDTFIVATSGRNEYRNKGIDLFLDSLESFAGMHGEGERQVLGLVLVPAWTGDVNDVFIEGKPSGLTFSTHHLHNEQDDLIFNRVSRMTGLQEKNVSVLYVPCYLDGKDGVVNLTYYQLLPAIDLTVFSSYYEPWGYTPLESIAFGVPTVTSDKAGFGQWVLSEGKEGYDRSGVRVISRTDSNYDEARMAIAHSVAFASGAGQQEISRIRALASETARGADWKIFINNYFRAFAVALENRGKRIKSINK